MDALLHYYGALVASTAAIVNGFIAVVVAQFSKITKLPRWFWWSPHCGDFYSQHQIVAAARHDNQLRLATKTLIGAGIREGEQLTKDWFTKEPMALKMAQSDGEYECM